MINNYNNMNYFLIEISETKGCFEPINDGFIFGQSQMLKLSDKNNYWGNFSYDDQIFVTIQLD